MEKSTQTKRALIPSLLAVILCVAMLVGTTFAWFTDTASTSVNKIQAGNLDVALEMATAWNAETSEPTTWASAEGQTLTFKTTDNRAADKILWEPGCTYELPELRVVNNGNLALKYKVVITGIKGSAKLNGAIEWTMKLDGTDYAVDTEHKLAASTAAATDSDTFTISGHMDENAGNEYQGESIEGISITVYATQDTVEYDSNNNQYDGGAAITVIGNNATIETTGDNKNIVIAETAVINASTSIGNGTTISGTGVDTTTVEVEKAKISTDNVTISDMTINGSGASGTTGALGISGNNTTVENIVFNGEGSGAPGSRTIAVTVSTGENNTGTTFKNMAVTNTYRGINFLSLSGSSLIENCVISAEGGTIGVDAVVAGATLTVKNTTLNGWTSYTSGIEKVSFEGCRFGLNTYEYLRPYSTTELTNCEFTSSNYKLNAGGTGAYTITLTNCTKNGTAITADNVKTLLLDADGWNSNATLIVNGTTVNIG